ncbi:hypothetical protein [Streptomyces spectabilis]|uniref:Uncharacterized protein n=1 Tax=Streptomyces spectabilis TaxID=68270 RepID=A0A7W8EXE8_STRST|nr:hypothetical protein [Streptomyces spectabilis]MBB5109002.1 hypothetical protein [Streptomyces spectabilis]
MAGQLAEQEAIVSRLEITRETMTEILSGAEPVTGPDEEPEGETGQGEEPVMETDPFEAGSPVGVRLVPPWSAELRLEALPRGYADIVEVLADAVHPMRAHQLCSMLGLSTDKSKVEGFRSKLKRLSGRGWITEVSPGLFASRDRALQERAPGQDNDSAVSPRAGEQEGSRT